MIISYGPYYFGIPDPLPDLGPEWEIIARPDQYLRAHHRDTGLTYLVCKDEPGRLPGHTLYLERPATANDRGVIELRIPIGTLIVDHTQWIHIGPVHHLSQPSTPVKTAEQRILDERERQITAEGWTEAHDDQHVNGELAAAAGCYASAAKMMMETDDYPLRIDQWPFEDDWWKPGDDPNRCLEKAGALYMAESSRLRRAGDHEGHLRAAAEAQFCIQKLDESLNIDAQEEIYTALWDFAEAQRTGPFDAKRDTDDVPLNTPAAGEACARIMRAFGLTPVDYGH